jgi:hypothetical protein
MRHHPWLARLLDGAGLPDHGRPLVAAAGEIDGVPVQVVELTGPFPGCEHRALERPCSLRRTAGRTRHRRP